MKSEVYLNTQKMRRINKIAMNSKKKIRFDESTLILKERKVAEFCDYLIELYSIISCDCFFGKQEESIYKNQLSVIEKIKDDPSDFDLNLIKGFVYLRNKNEEKSYKYLTNALQVDKTIDLPYSLRATIASEINPENKNDAKNAVQINPSARNYFILATNLADEKDDKELRKAINYCDKAIQLIPNFACAYKIRANSYLKLKDFNKASKNFEKCIEIGHEHRLYYSYWHSLFNENKYLEALKVAKIGAYYNFNAIDYQLSIGVTYMMLNKFEDAISYLEKYFIEQPDSKLEEVTLKVAQKKVEDDVTQNKVNNALLNDAKKHFQENDFQNAINLFESHLKKGGDLYHEDLDIYLKSLLKKRNKEVAFGVNNKIYKKLNDLKYSSDAKIAAGENLLKEEENIVKLIVYNSSTIIGFGKYAGKDISTLIEEDPHYILWCIVNLTHFSIEKSLFLEDRLKSEAKFLIALEYNLIKQLIIEKWDLIEDNYIRSYDMEGDWGSLYGEEAEIGSWNTH